MTGVQSHADCDYRPLRGRVTSSKCGGGAVPQAHYRHLRALRALRGRLRRGINPGQGRSARRGLGRAGHAGAQSHELRQASQSVQVRYGPSKA